MNIYVDFKDLPEGVNDDYAKKIIKEFEKKGWSTFYADYDEVIFSKEIM